MFGRQGMQRIGLSLVIGIFFLTACGQATVVPTLPSATSTPSVLPTATHTSSPTATATTSVTPLPTIPTFTPTFDVSTIVTVTPAPKAECPKLDSTIRVEHYLPEKLEYPSPDTTAKILDFLNTGGDGKALIARLEMIYPYGGDYRGGYGIYDVTGDQSPDFLHVEIDYEGRLLAFSCKDGKYELLATLPKEKDFLEYTMKIVNLNMNGIPEIVVMGTNGVSHPVSTIFFYEWNGKTFSNLGRASILALRQTQIKDIDGNGIQEIIWIGDNPGCLSCSNFIPQRQRTITYGWNGKEYVEISSEFEPAEYRFQALQDADTAVLLGKYEIAALYYLKTIDNEKLEWWSPERLQYKQARGYSWMPEVTLPPEPLADRTEYPRLAAYAYYRIMLLHIVQGHESDAGTVYKTLQQKFGHNPYGHPYVEMATAFWNTYQSTHKMYDGCAEAIHYAVEHPEILIPLGSDFHGWQSHIYVPADVCPFR